MRGETNRERGNAGFALVAVLAVTALLSSLLLALSLWSRNVVENVAVARADLRMEALLRSAATIAAYQLFVLKLPPAQVSAQLFTLDSGTATIMVAEDSGKVDLNRAPPELLAAAYQTSGLTAMAPAVFAARVIDWRDGDTTPSNGGAEIDAYESAGLPPPRNGTFRTFSDLLSVLGVSEPDVAALTPFMTVFNPSGRLNPYETPLALLDNLTGSAVKSKEQLRTLARSRRSKDTDGKIADLLTEQSALLDFGPPSIFRVSILGQTRDAPLTRQIEVIISASALKNTPFQILSWAEEPSL